MEDLEVWGASTPATASPSPDGASRGKRRAQAWKWRGGIPSTLGSPFLSRGMWGWMHRRALDERVKRRPGDRGRKRSQGQLREQEKPLERALEKAGNLQKAEKRPAGEKEWGSPVGGEVGEGTPYLRPPAPPRPHYTRGPRKVRR